MQFISSWKCSNVLSIFLISAKKKRIDQHFCSTSAKELEEMSAQWSRVIYTNNLPFSLADNSEFKKAINLMRPGVGDRLMTRKDVAGKLLTNEHDKIDAEMRSVLQVNRFQYFKSVRNYVRTHKYICFNHFLGERSHFVSRWMVKCSSSTNYCYMSACYGQNIPPRCSRCGR